MRCATVKLTLEGCHWLTLLVGAGSIRASYQKPVPDSGVADAVLPKMAIFAQLHKKIKIAFVGKNAAQYGIVLN